MEVSSEPVEQPLSETAQSPGLVTALAAAASLAACGGGGGADSPAPVPPPTVLPTAVEASRFLGQAAFAATDDHLARVQAVGYAAWIDEQLAQPRTTGHYDTMIAAGLAVASNEYTFTGTDNTLWRKLISSPDVLRQRVTLALSEIFVVSMLGLPLSWRGFSAAAYMDVLEANAFGNYRDLLQAVTLSPAMGTYLNLRGNQKGDASGRQPDENYAREVLQLFSIGLVELNPDGTLRGGVATDTYTQDTITNLARVFTGWEFDGFNHTEPSYTIKPMVFLASRFDTGSKQFLGTTIASTVDGVTAMKLALDTIAAHPNVGPFIGRQLIQRLVCSQPSAAYVGRVSAVWANNGSGVRGDLKAVIKAILLDSEARRAPTSADTTRGKLREPVQRLVQWARTFKLSSPTGLWNIPDTSDPSTRLGQSPLRAPSVFNFFRPGYVPPNSPLGTLGVQAPEFQITNESTVVAWANFMQSTVFSGLGETRPDYSAELPLAADAAALVARINLLLAHGALGADTVATITQAINSMSASNDNAKLNRVRAAVFLVLCAPEYLVQV